MPEFSTVKVRGAEQIMSDHLNWVLSFAVFITNIWAVLTKKRLGIINPAN